MAIDGRELCILLVKNPTGANEVLRTLALEPGEHDLLGVLNDRTADGHDVSWIWDADFEPLARRIRRGDLRGHAGGRARPPPQVRRRPAGADRPRAEPRRRPRRGRWRPRRSGATLYALPTYTAMLELRTLLVSRGAAASSWALA